MADFEALAKELGEFLHETGDSAEEAGIRAGWAFAVKAFNVSPPKDFNQRVRHYYIIAYSEAQSTPR